MKFILEIKDSKVDFVMELLSNFKFVKAKPIPETKARVIDDLKEAVDEMHQVKAGKLKATALKDVLNEL